MLYLLNLTNFSYKQNKKIMIIYICDIFNPSIINNYLRN